MEMQIALAAYDPCNEPKRVRAEKMTENHCPVVPEPCKNSFPVSIKLSVRRSSSPRNGGYFEKTHAPPLSVSSRSNLSDAASRCCLVAIFGSRLKMGFGSILHLLFSVASFFHTSDGAQWPNLSVRRRSFVQYDDCRILRQNTGDLHALPLAAGKILAPSMNGAPSLEHPKVTLRISKLPESLLYETLSSRGGLPLG